MLVADTVMDTDGPRFKIGEDEMYYRQIGRGNLWVATFGNGKVFIPPLAKTGIYTPTVRPVSRRHLRQLRIPGRVDMGKGSPTAWQRGQTNPPPQRVLSE